MASCYQELVLIALAIELRRCSLRLHTDPLGYSAIAKLQHIGSKALHMF